jgi:LCP family protein required for cell wall assembly
MIVVTIDPESGALGMLSIPRDLWVPIPGYGENRINTAHFLGDLHKYPGGGPALAKKTVSYNFGFPVHYYVRVNFEGFRRLIDMIGGIDIDVPHEIRDDQYPDENYGYDPLYIPAGRIHMDGDLALKYARTRKADNDFERARRQQQIILAVRDKVLSLNLLPSLIPKIPELLRTLSDSIQTDIPMDELIMLARLARDLNTENIKTAVIDETMTVPQTTPTGAYVLLPIREKIRPVVEDLFLSPLPTVAPKR